MCQKRFCALKKRRAKQIDAQKHALKNIRQKQKHNLKHSALQRTRAKKIMRNKQSMRYKKHAQKQNLRNKQSMR